MVDSFGNTLLVTPDSYSMNIIPAQIGKGKKKSKFKKPFAAAQKTRNENAKSGQEGFPGGPSNPTSLQLARMSFHFNFFLFGKKIEEKEYKGL